MRKTQHASSDLAGLIEKAKAVRPSTNSMRYTDEEVLNAYIKTGNVSAASKLLGCCRPTVYSRLLKLGVR